jgi:hypothetical protein
MPEHTLFAFTIIARLPTPPIFFNYHYRGYQRPGQQKKLFFSNADAMPTARDALSETLL